MAARDIDDYAVSEKLRELFEDHGTDAQSNEWIYNKLGVAHDARLKRRIDYLLGEIAKQDVSCFCMAGRHIHF